MAKEKYSYSKLDTYKQCGFKFKTKYLDKNFLTGGAIALDFGNLIHDTEEKIANMLKEGKAVDYVTLKNNFIKKMYEIEHKFPKDFMTPDKSNRTYKEKCYHYLENSIYCIEKYMYDHPELEIVGAEIPFNFEYKDVILNGKIDSIFRNKTTGQYIIQDIKSYNVPMDHEDLVTPLQFVTYIVAVEHDMGISRDNIICQYYLPLVPTPETDLPCMTHDAGTKGFMKRGLEKIDALFAGINAGEFSPKPSALCHWCEFCPTNPNVTEKGKKLCPFYSLYTKEHPTYAVNVGWDKTKSFKENIELYESLHGKIGE